MGIVGEVGTDSRMKEIAPFARFTTKISNEGEPARIRNQRAGTASE